MYTLNCEHCGKEYQSARKDKRFCCDSHRAMHNKGRTFVAQNETKRNVTLPDLSQIIESILAAIVLNDPISEFMLIIQNMNNSLEAIRYRLDNPIPLQTITQSFTMPVTQPSFDLPKAIVTIAEESPERVAQRKADSIKNTLSAMADF